MSEPRDEIAEVLAAHTRLTYCDSPYACACDRHTQHSGSHNEHLATVLAERDRRVAGAAIRDLVRDIDSTGYGWTSVVSAERFKDRLRERADRIERGE